MSNPIFNLFAPSLDVDHAERPWPLIRAGIMGTLLLIAGISTWVWLAPISGAVIGPGFVKVDMNRKTVQHQEGGIVSEILVRDGSKVKAGETLIVLKDVRVDAGNEAVRTQLDAELAKAARLSAEVTYQNIDFPAELLERRSDTRVAELLKHESTVFRVRREALANQISLLQSQAREARDEIKARSSQMKADDEAIKLQRQELAANASLANQGFVSKTRLLTLQRDTPTVNGTVTYISADRLVDKDNKNAPYYMVHVRVSPDSLKRAGDLQLQAGMPAEVFIQTTPRNALQYLVDPILAFLQRSLREQ